MTNTVTALGIALMKVGLCDPYKTEEELLKEHYQNLVKATFDKDCADTSIIDVLNYYIKTYSGSEVGINSEVKSVEITSYSLFNYLRIESCEEEFKNCWICGKTAYVNIDAFFRMFVRTRQFDNSIRIQVMDTKVRQGIQKINLISLNDLV